MVLLWTVAVLLAMPNFIPNVDLEEDMGSEFVRNDVQDVEEENCKGCDCLWRKVKMCDR